MLSLFLFSDAGQKCFKLHCEYMCTANGSTCRCCRQPTVSAQSDEAHTFIIFLHKHQLHDYLVLFFSSLDITCNTSLVKHRDILPATISSEGGFLRVDYTVVIAHTMSKGFSNFAPL